MAGNSQKITTVSVCDQVVAEVFRGKGGFFILDVSNDAQPLGPFKSRKRAEEVAANCTLTERWLREMCEDA